MSFLTLLFPRDSSKNHGRYLPSVPLAALAFVAAVSSTAHTATAEGKAKTTSKLSSHTVAQYDYVATTKADQGETKDLVKAGGLTWECVRHQCLIAGPWQVPGVGSCRELAKQVGPVTSYGHDTARLSEKQLRQCNKDLNFELPSPGNILSPPSEIVGPQERKLPSPQTLPSPGEIQAPVGKIRPKVKSPLEVALPAVQIPLGDRGIGEAELQGVVETLNRTGSRRYHLAMFRRRGVAEKGAGLKVLRSESINGLLLGRDRSTMDPLFWGLYHDGLRNLAYFGSFMGKAGRRVPYSITSTSWGETILSADHDLDGIADVALGNIEGDGRLWLMSQVNFKRLLQCLEEAGLADGGANTFIAASLCVPCLDPAADPGSMLSSEELNCINRRQDGDGAGLQSAFPAGPMKKLFGEPQCAPGRPGRGATADDVVIRRGPFPRPQRITFITSSRDTGEVVRTRSATTTHYPGGGSLTVYTEDRQFGRVTGDIREERYSDGSGGVIVAQTNREGDTKVFHEDDDPGDSDSSGSTTQPGLGSDGMPVPNMEDPRCAGNKTSVAQGSIWGPQCRNPDGSHIGIMECVRRMTDSTAAITGNRCWEAPGPAGGTVTVCEGSQRSRGSGSSRGDDPSGGISPGGDASDTTDGTRGSVGGPARGTGGRYIDVTPMGAFLAAICARGGCPEGPPMGIEQMKRPE